MGKFIKAGKCVILLGGRYAGKKAVVVRNFDSGTKDRPYGHCIVAGVERYPRKVKKGMPKKKIVRRTSIKPFVKVVNYNHILPTRYGFEGDLKDTIKVETMQHPDKRNEARKNVGKLFQERFNSGKNEWFFSKLCF